MRISLAVSVVVAGVLIAPVEHVAAEDHAGGIEEIVVTAQKREQRLQDVPISLTVLGADLFEEAGIVDFQDLAPYVPGSSITADPTLPTVTLRGFGTIGSNEGFEPSVGLVLDDLALARPLYLSTSLFDVERVEVLAGPQGTLFGKNTSAGVINVVTKEPTDDLTANVGAYAGTFEQARVEGGVGGPIFETLTARLGFLYDYQGEHTFNTYLDREENAGDHSATRLKLRWAPSERWELMATGMGAWDHTNYWSAQLSHLEPNTTAYLRSFDPAVEGDPLDLQTSQDLRGRWTGETYLGQLRAAWFGGPVGPLSDLTVRAILGRTGYRVFNLLDLDNSPADLLPNDFTRSYDQDSLELQVQATAESFFGWGGPVHAIVGVYGFHAENAASYVIYSGGDLPSYLTTEDALELVTVTDVDLPPTANVAEEVGNALGIDVGSLTREVIGNDNVDLLLDQTILSGAVFGELTWNLTPKLSTTAGARLTTETKEGDFRTTSNGELGLTAELFRLQEFETERRRSEVDATPKASIQYDWTDDVMTFFTYSTGFKGGGFNQLALQPSASLEFEPEKSQAMDLGVKTTLFDDTLSLNATLFYETFEDLQLQIFNGATFYVVNAQGATSKGLESNFRWQTPWTPLGLEGSVFAAEIRYDDGAVGPAPIFSGSTTQDLEGKRLAFAPETAFTLSPTFDHQLPTLPWAGDTSLRIRFDVLHTGDQYLAAPLDSHTRQEAFTLYNARIGLVGANGRWTLQFDAENFTDTRFLIAQDNSVLFPGSYTGAQALGRLLGVTVRIRF